MKNKNSEKRELPKAYIVLKSAGKMVRYAKSMVTPARFRALIGVVAFIGIVMLGFRAIESIDDGEVAVIDCGEGSELDVRFEDGVQYVGLCDVYVYPDEYRMRGKYPFLFKSKVGDLYIETVVSLSSSKHEFQTFHRLFQKVQKDGEFQTFEEYLDNTIRRNISRLTGQEEEYAYKNSYDLRGELEKTLERRFFGDGIDFAFPHFDAHITHDLEKE